MRDFETGIVYVNAGTTGAETHLPFGGIKDTGNGHREAGHAALDTYTEWKSIYVDFSGRLQRAQIDNQPELDRPMPTSTDVRRLAIALPEAEEILTWETDITFRVRAQDLRDRRRGRDPRLDQGPARPPVRAHRPRSRRRSRARRTSAASAGRPWTSSGSIPSCSRRCFVVPGGSPPRNGFSRRWNLTPDPDVSVRAADRRRDAALTPHR